jgi:serine/threonine protein kinase
MPKSVSQCIDELIKSKDKPPTEVTKLYKLIKPLSGGKSGALVYQVLTDDNKKCVLKYYNKEGNRNLRDLIVSCRLSGIDGFPKVYKMGYTLAPREWSPDVDFESDRSYYILMSMINGEVLSKMNIKMGVEKALNVSLSILHRLIQARNALGDDFEHYDLHPNNIIVDMKKCEKTIMLTKNDKYKVQCPPVYIIDFDLVKASGIKCIPEDKEHINKKEGYLGILSTIVPQVTWAFTMKWKDSILETYNIIKRGKNIMNTDIRNWIVISSVIFEENGIGDTIEVCRTATECVNRNKGLFEKLKI